MGSTYSITFWILYEMNVKKKKEKKNENSRKNKKIRENKLGLAKNIYYTRAVIFTELNWFHENFVTKCEKSK